MKVRISRGVGWAIDRTKEEDFLRLAILKEKAAYRAFWLEHGGEKVRDAYQRITDFYDKGGDPGEVFRACRVEGEQVDCFTCGLYKFGITLLGISPLLEESLVALDPFNPELPARIPFNFEDPAPIIQVQTDNEPGEHYHKQRASIPLKPSERLLKVDLSRKRGELLADFKQFLDAVEYKSKSEDIPQSYRDNYKEWKQDRTRQVKEAWRHLEVWRQVWHGKPFFQIAADLGITIDQAKDSFTRAFELIEGRKYDRELCRERYLKTLTAQEVATPCQGCKDAAGCDPLVDNCKKLSKFWERIAKQEEGGGGYLFIADLAPEKQRKIGAF